MKESARILFATFAFGASALWAAGAAELANAHLRVEQQPGGVTRVWRQGEAEPFASVDAPAADCAWTVRLDGDAPFVFFDFGPAEQAKDRTVHTLAFPRIRLLKQEVARTVAQTYRGPTNAAAALASYTYMAFAEPKSRTGVVAAWLTSVRASGIVKSAVEGDGIVIRPEAQYGRWDIRAHAHPQGETFVLGAFDDCRLGLEAYADAAARRHHVALPPPVSGYCTWYADKNGWGGDEVSTRAFMDAVKRLRLTEWGFDYFQIDDKWQDGAKKPGPAKNFTRVDPTGPYKSGMKPTADYITGRCAIAGLWFMPFSGTPTCPWWADKTNLFLKSAVDRPGKGAHCLAQQKGQPFTTVFGGGALDMTNPEATHYLSELTRRITYDWGYSLIKFDGMYAAMGVDLALSKVPCNTNDALGQVTFFDAGATPVEAFRRGIQTMRAAAKPGTRLLACNIAQNGRAMAPSYGLVDLLRIGGDNGPIHIWPERYMAGPIAGTPRYFLNGRVWHSDPDPVYVRDAVPEGRARLFASWTALGGMLYNFSDWLPDLSPARVEILKRTLAAHRLATKARPVDYFERNLANTWVLDGGDVKIFGFYNWDTNRTLDVAHDAAYAGLDPEKTYVGFDFWNKTLVPPFKGTLKATVPADDCRVVAVTEALDRPVLLGTSRHVASPLFEVTNLQWRYSWLDRLLFERPKLSGESTVVAGESYDLYFYLPAGWRITHVSDNPECSRRVDIAGPCARVHFPCRGTRKISWRVAFSR